MRGYDGFVRQRSRDFHVSAAPTTTPGARSRKREITSYSGTPPHAPGSSTTTPKRRPWRQPAEAAHSCDALSVKARRSLTDGPGGDQPRGPAPRSGRRGQAPLRAEPGCRVSVVMVQPRTPYRRFYVSRASLRGLLRPLLRSASVAGLGRVVVAGVELSAKERGEEGWGGVRGGCHGSASWAVDRRRAAAGSARGAAPP